MRELQVQHATTGHLINLHAYKTDMMTDIQEYNWWFEDQGSLGRDVST